MTTKPYNITTNTNAARYWSAIFGDAYKAVEKELGDAIGDARAMVAADMQQAAQEIADEEEEEDDSGECEHGIPYRGHVCSRCQEIARCQWGGA